MEIEVEMKQKKIMIIATIVVFALVWSLNYVQTHVYSRALIKAIEKDDMKQLESLLKKPGDVNSPPYGKNILTFIFLVETPNEVPLSVAAYKGNFEMVKHLVEAGANVNSGSSGWAPLIHTLQSPTNEKYKIANYLIDKGAKVNPKGIDYDNSTVIENVFWRTASEEESYKLFKRLIKMGVPIESEDYYGNNVIFSAASGNNILALEYLVEERNVDVNRKSEFNYTPLTEATRSDAIDAVKYLLSKGADKTVKDKDGMTAYDYAVENENQEMMELLRLE